MALSTVETDWRLLPEWDHPREVGRPEAGSEVGPDFWMVVKGKDFSVQEVDVHENVVRQTENDMEATP